jgi:HAD superfamily hydrolase (TIGR01490 family)
MEIGAFFDLDGTVINGNSGLRFMQFLFLSKVLKPKKSEVIPGIKLIYKYVKGDMKEAIDDSDNLLALAFKGANKFEVEKAAEFFVLEDMKYFNDKMIERIKYHKSQGHKIILMSVSPDELVKKFGNILKFDYCVGSRFTVKNGIYTGELVIPSMIGKERASVAKSIAKKMKIDLKLSYAYGNCINDLEVLQLTGNPFAVNPNKYLIKVARQKGIRII